MSRSTGRRIRPTQILLAASALLFASVVLAQALGLYQFVPVLSGSMSGYVEAGDVTVLRPMDAANLLEGDVIAFFPPVPDATLTLHRVVQITEPGPNPVVRTKGDANDAVDPWLAQLQGPSLWRASSTIPKVGHVVLWLQDPTVRFVTLTLSLLIVMAIGLRRLWRPAGAAGAAHVATSPSSMDGIHGPDPSTETDRPPPRTGPHIGGVISLLLVVTAVVIAGVMQPGSASFTDAETASHTVRTGSVLPPSELRAALACDAGVPRSVQLDWTLSPSQGVVYQEVWRVSPGSESVLIVSVRPDVSTAQDDVVDALLAGSNAYAVRAVADGWTSEFSNEASLLTLCDPPDPEATALPVDPDATPLPVDPDATPLPVDPDATPLPVDPDATPLPVDPDATAPPGDPESDPDPLATPTPTLEPTPTPTLEPTPIPTDDPVPTPTLEPDPVSITDRLEPLVPMVRP